MLEYQDRTVQEVAACTCDRCQRRMTPDDLDWHEKLSIAYRGGFDSIFGDGCEVNIDLCQRCVKETLGTWLRITSPEMDAPTFTGADGLKYQEHLRAEWEGHERDASPLPPPARPSWQSFASEPLGGSVLRYENPTDPVWPSAEKGPLNPVLQRLHETHASAAYAARVLEVQARALDVFEDMPTAMQWLLTDTPLLGGMRPIDAVTTASGHERVLALLVRIEHGGSV